MSQTSDCLTNVHAVHDILKTITITINIFKAYTEAFIGHNTLLRRIYKYLTVYQNCSFHNDEAINKYSYDKNILSI